MESERAIGRNEALFREVNERIREITAGQGVPLDERVLFQCECGRLECHEQVQLSLGEYEAVRAEPKRFVILPGHEIEAVETVVSRNERFLVVEKHGEAADAAE
jgi:hypothetical protein